MQKETVSLNDMTVKYNDMLADRTRLSRLLARVQADFERLNMENVSRTAYANEEMALERELESAKSQLENEKNAREHAEAEVSRQAEEIAMVSTQLDIARRELELQVRGDRQQKSAELEGKGIKELSRHEQTGGHGLHQTRNSPGSHGVHAATSTDMTIATPGASQFRKRANNKSSALPGEKSAFSITPFLNKRTNSFHNSSTPSGEEFDGLDDNTTTATRSGTADAHSPLQSPFHVPVPDQETVSRPLLFKSTTALPRSLEREDTNKNKRPLAPNGVQGKAKKRRLGAQRDRIIVDGDEGEDLFAMRRPGRKLSIFGGLPATLPTDQQWPRQNRGGGFDLTAAGTFSPLKRDRRR